MIGLALFYLLFPAVILIACRKYSWLDKIGAVMLSYAAGLIIGNIGIYPLLSPDIHDLLTLDSASVKKQAKDLFASGEWTAQQYAALSIYQLQDTLMSISILVALPLLLFSTDLRVLVRSAKTTLQSLLIAVVAVSSMVFVGFIIFRGIYGEQLWKVGGMLVGVYTGGTPNLASLKMMLNVEPATYILIHSYDLIVSFTYLVFLLTIGKKIFRKLLPPDHQQVAFSNAKDEPDSLVVKFEKKHLPSIAKGLGLALIIVAISAAVAFQVPPSALMITIILIITTLSLLASLKESVRTRLYTYETGMYLILIFSLIVASMVDVQTLLGITPVVFGYLALVVFGSLLLQLIFSKIFKIDSDTLMVTSVAFICSPPFVPVIAGALNNRKIIVPGITIGVIGYALGNYLGFLMAELLKIF
ncbi:DUF819 family protein [Mongoliitalea daihaiensis]|uniref:DUF819 family protein n=1 Tax=Mongoliitalea daihaiensis TaxID=2782006 RepID=UPI001F426219|nr:DUF819 family protein [Mongoliitalea daihaiensis]UJP63705.1 DUF819 family protein [Mongoliitalea daihaiensis]